MSTRKIQKVAVLGAGLMGSGIAAHLANAGVPCYLLDIVPRDLSDAEKANPAARNRMAANGLQAALKSKPASFMTPNDADLVTIGNFEDNMGWLKEVDWVVEVVVENPKIKQMVFENVEKNVGPETIISSNTSGIPISVMTEGRSDDFKRRFLVTHFFNPVRYMKLLEIVAGPTTDPAIVETLAHFGEYTLGKGIVYGKDTTNFVANRIGVHSMMATIQYMVNNGYTIAEVDAIVGAPLGRPKTAAFKTADLVGLDTFVHVAQNCYDNLTEDEDREVFKVPDFIHKMVEKGLLGNKTKAGFYKKDGKARFVLDPATLEYVELGDRPEFDSVSNAKGSPAKKCATMAYADDRAGKLVWDLMKQTLPYAARRMGEIADTIVDIDNGMKWGFNWKLGPFETWDAIGVRKSVEKMKAEGTEIPAIIQAFLDGDNETFYKTEGETTWYYDFNSKSYKELAKSDAKMSIAGIKTRENAVVASNDEASLIDLGDGVLGLEFHSKMNAIGAEMIEQIHAAVDLLEGSNDWAGMVVTNEAENFSVGANLFMIWMAAQQGEWAQVEAMVDRLQQGVMRMKYCSKPVVTAPFGFTFGGGCEVAMHGQATVAAGETYIGLVEVGVGVIPAGGGTKELVVRNVKSVPEGTQVDIFPFVRKAFETIGMAKVATSGKEAKTHFFLRPTDTVVLNRDHLTYRAKQTVLGMATAGYDPGRPVTDLRLPGPDAAATLKLGLMTMMQGGYISQHDYLIGSKLAYICTGGNTNMSKKLTEQDLLELEKEVFLSLCGEEKSQERMQYMLMNNKPLRN